MRAVFLSAAILLALSACAEVTSMRNRDGSVDYYIDCGNGLRLESCKSAMARTCPSGYTLRPAGPQAQPDPNQPGQVVERRNDGLFRCR